MKFFRPLRLALIAPLLALGAIIAAREPAAAAAVKTLKLAGTWSLVAADVLHPDGTRTHDYGAAPTGLLMIDAKNDYSLQLFKAERPEFASGDKNVGSPQEFKAAVSGSSTHYGTLEVDVPTHTLIFNITNASFPNWIGQHQKRTFELKGNALSYRVVPRPNGDVPISVWRRVS
jgi:hypothetical protein